MSKAGLDDAFGSLNDWGDPELLNSSDVVGNDKYFVAQNYDYTEILSEDVHIQPSSVVDDGVFESISPISTSSNVSPQVSDLDMSSSDISYLNSDVGELSDNFVGVSPSSTTTTATAASTTPRTIRPQKRRAVSSDETPDEVRQKKLELNRKAAARSRTKKRMEFQLLKEENLVLQQEVDDVKIKNARLQAQLNKLMNREGNDDNNDDPYVDIGCQTEDQVQYPHPRHPNLPFLLPNQAVSSPQPSPPPPAVPPPPASAAPAYFVSFPFNLPQYIPVSTGSPAVRSAVPLFSMGIFALMLLAIVQSAYKPQAVERGADSTCVITAMVKKVVGEFQKIDVIGSDGVSFTDGGTMKFSEEVFNPSVVPLDPKIAGGKHLCTNWGEDGNDCSRTLPWCSDEDQGQDQDQDQDLSDLKKCESGNRVPFSISSVFLPDLIPMTSVGNFPQSFVEGKTKKEIRDMFQNTHPGCFDYFFAKNTSIQFLSGGWSGGGKEIIDDAEPEVVSVEFVVTNTKLKSLNDIFGDSSDFVFPNFYFSTTNHIDQLVNERFESRIDLPHPPRRAA